MGLLDVACETWKEQPSLFWTVVKCMQEMQERLNQVTPIVKQHVGSSDCPALGLQSPSPISRVPVSAAVGPISQLQIPG